MVEVDCYSLRSICKVTRLIAEYAQEQGAGYGDLISVETGIYLKDNKVNLVSKTVVRCSRVGVVRTGIFGRED